MALLPASLGTAGFAGGFYSYVDENGVRVFTNLGGRCAASPPVARTAQDSNPYRSLIRELAAEHGIAPELIEAIVQVESGFDPWAVSQKNCKGLMQLHPETAERFGVQDIFNPRENVTGGILYLKHLMDVFGGNLDWVLAGYNAGENAVKQYRGIPPFPETQEYVSKVRALLPASLADGGSGGNRGREHRIVRLRASDGSIVLTNLPVEELPPQGLVRGAVEPEDRSADRRPAAVSGVSH
ncbi:MAG: hypothetical protein Kow00109_11440 [Acidobacteriota bacterium]